MSGGTLDSASGFHLSLTRLSLSLARLPIQLQLNYGLHIAVLTPKVLLPSVWPTPLSLATTQGISVDVFSSPYLDVSVQAVPPIHLLIQCMVTGLDSGRVSPFGHPRVRRLLSANRGFS